MKLLSKEDIRTFLSQLQAGRKIRVFVKPGDINDLRNKGLGVDNFLNTSRLLSYNIP